MIPLFQGLSGAIWTNSGHQSVCRSAIGMQLGRQICNRQVDLQQVGRSPIGRQVCRQICNRQVGMQIYNRQVGMQICNRQVGMQICNRQVRMQVDLQQVGRYVGRSTIGRQVSMQALPSDRSSLEFRYCPLFEAITLSETHTTLVVRDSDPS